jgi:hypothetical protein
LCFQRIDDASEPLVMIKRLMGLSANGRYFLGVDFACERFQRFDSPGTEFLF